MHIISTRTHSFLDYISGLLLTIGAYVFELGNESVETWVVFIAGILILTPSLFTDYEGGLVKLVPMSIHLFFELAIGLLLVASPWIFGFSSYGYGTHLVCGIVIVAITVLSANKPYQKRDKQQTP